MGCGIVERRVINSFGNITIPARIRKELGIEGSSMLWLDVREGRGGQKEIVLKKQDDVDEIFNRYKKWAEVISRIAESAVSIVWNSLVVSMSFKDETDNFITKKVSVSTLLNLSFKQSVDDAVVVKNPKELKFLPNGIGDVSAFYRIKNTGDDSGYFVIVKGTKYDVKITKEDELRRYNIIKDIVNKI